MARVDGAAGAVVVVESATGISLSGAALELEEDAWGK